MITEQEVWVVLLWCPDDGYHSIIAASEQEAKEYKGFGDYAGHGKIITRLPSTDEEPIGCW